MGRRAPLLVVAFVTLLAATPLLEAGDVLVGNACNLTEPPSDAGETALETRRTKLEAWVYPRLSALPPGYSGCQVLWTSINGKSARSLILLINGRVESTDPPLDEPLCAKGEKSIVTGCYPRREALQASFPAGCVARRVGSAYPKDCMDSFLEEMRILDATID